jgi:ABC-2 type transport system permease protein
MATIRSANVRLVARREFLVRARTRSFRIGTLIVVIGALAVSLLPVLVRFIEGTSTGEKVAVFSASDLGYDPAARFNAILDVPSITGSGPAFAFADVAHENAARAGVRSGDVSAAILISRAASGELGFTVVTKDGPASRVPTLLRQASSAMAVEDRMARQGLSAAQQAAIFAPALVTFEKPDSNAKGAPSGVGQIAGIIAGQILVVFIFVAIILYGQWVAMSVAEEKSSRVIEVVINAATPSELLGGKVIGVGGLGLVQYFAAVIPAIVVLLLQDRISQGLLGGPASSGSGIDLGGMGITPGVFLAFGIFFILGYTLYATLYAAAGSLVSRMEDVSSVVLPMTMLGMVGYLVAVYAASGLIPIEAGWVVALSFVPFMSPYLMLSRLMAGTAGASDVVIAVLILLASIVVALWVAARVYGAGVLMYGQKASFRLFVRTAFRRRA